MSESDEAKRVAAEAAVREVQNDTIVGLGSGTTVIHVIKFLAKRIKEKNLSIQAIPASTQTELCCIENKIPLTQFTASQTPSLTIDGADQVDPKTLNAIKGGGAAHAREKILASSSSRVIIAVDESKLCKGFLNRPVPIEVLPFAYMPILERLKKMGSTPSLRIGQKKNGPIITDNGNYVVDTNFGEMEDPVNLERRIKSIPGVLEVGIFTGLIDRVYVGSKNRQVRILE